MIKSNSSLLSAVAAAAMMPGAVMQSVSVNGSEVLLDVAFVKEHMPDVAAALVAEGKATGIASGAAAERERIAGIEAAALPGHEAIIKAHKDDPTKTPQDAAMAIIAAEKSARGRQLAALETDDKHVQVRSEPANSALAAAPASAGGGLVGEAKWKADYASSAQLQAEFGSEASYLALMRAETAGTVRRLKNRAA